MGAPASWMSDNAADQGALRLSPVEKANLSLINDPALDGYKVQGRAVPENASAKRYIRPEVDPQADCNPACLGKVVQDVIFVGPEITEVAMGTDGPCAADSVEVHPDNGRFSTDGVSLFSKDGSVLIRMVAARESYSVPKSCRHIGPRAFDSASHLKECTLHDGLETIGRLAFAKSGIAFIDIPGWVQTIGEKAFYCCKSLVAALLGEGVREIGTSAFALSGIERIRIPASVIEMGQGAFADTSAQKTVGAISISRNNDVYTLDSRGGLYKGEDFAELLSNVSDYTLRRGTHRILDNAFRRNMHIRHVSVPEGVRFIGDDAFRSCKQLVSVELPESLASIGAGAFMDTRIRELYLSKDVASIGDGALLVQGTNPTRQSVPLSRLELHPQNAVFYIESGILCERTAGADGGDKALCYVGPDSVVRIPDTVNRMAPYAFLGVSGIDELHVHSGMHSVCAGSFSVGESVPRVVVDLPARNGWDAVTVSLPMPSLSSRYRTFTDLFSADAAGTVFVFPYYDSWVTNTGAVHEFAPAALARLRKPVMLRSDLRSTYLSILDRKQHQVCMFFAANGDASALEDLAEWGVLEQATVKDCLEEVMRGNNTQARACLLEVMHRVWSSVAESAVPDGADTGVAADAGSAAQNRYGLDLSI